MHIEDRREDWYIRAATYLLDEYLGIHDYVLISFQSGGLILMDRLGFDSVTPCREIVRKYWRQSRWSS